MVTGCEIKQYLADRALGCVASICRAAGGGEARPSIAWPTIVISLPSHVVVCHIFRPSASTDGSPRRRRAAARRCPTAYRWAMNRPPPLDGDQPYRPPPCTQALGQRWSICGRKVLNKGAAFARNQSANQVAMSFWHWDQSGSIVETSTELGVGLTVAQVR